MESLPTTDPNTSFNFKDGELKIDWDKRQFQFQPATKQLPKSARRYSPIKKYPSPKIRTRSLPSTPPKYAHPLVTATEIDQWTQELMSEHSRRRNERAIHRSIPALKEFHLRLRQAPRPRPVKQKLKKWKSSSSTRRHKKKPSSARSVPRIRSFTTRLPRTALVTPRRRRRSYNIPKRNLPMKKSNKSKIIKRKHVKKANSKGLAKSKRKLKQQVNQCIAPQMLDWMDQLLEKRRKTISQIKTSTPKPRRLKSTSALTSLENEVDQPKTWGGNRGRSKRRIRRQLSARSAAGSERRTPKNTKSSRPRRHKSPWNYNSKNYGSRPSRVLTPRQPNLLRDHENPKNYWNPATGTSISRVEEKIIKPSSLVQGIDKKQSIAGNVLKLQRENRELKTQLTQLKKDAERASADELLSRLNKQMRYLTKKLNER